MIELFVISNGLMYYCTSLTLRYLSVTGMLQTNSRFIILLSWYYVQCCISSVSYESTSSSHYLLQWHK